MNDNIDDVQCPPNRPVLIKAESGEYGVILVNPAARAGPPELLGRSLLFRHLPLLRLPLLQACRVMLFELRICYCQVTCTGYRAKVQANAEETG